MILAVLLAAATPSANDHRAATEEFFAAFNKRDFAAMEKLYAPDAKLTSSDFCRPRGKADIRRTYQKLFDGHPDVRDVIEVILVEGDRAAVRFTAVSEMGKNGMRLPIMTFLRFRDGLIVEDDTIFDTGSKQCDP